MNSKSIRIIIGCLGFGIFLNYSLAMGAPLDEVRVGGDFRYRHEYYKAEGADERHRHRIRGRLKLGANVNDQTDVTLRLATGGSGSGSATSTNQTLGGGFSNKDFALDLAYINWRPANPVSVMVGKMTNPFYSPNKIPLIWDGDVTPEGASVQIGKPGQMGGFFNFGAFWLEERSAETDSSVSAAQAGFTTDGFGKDKVIFGLGYLGFMGIKGQPPLLGKAAGNTLDASGNYQGHFQVGEAFAEYQLKAKMPLSLGVLAIHNMAVGSKNRGFASSLSLGSTKEQGWQVKYSYLELEPDATLGLLTDSDLFESQTNARGHILKASLNVGKGTTTALSLFKTDVDLESPEVVHRAQLDLEFAF